MQYFSCVLHSLGYCNCNADQFFTTVANGQLRRNPIENIVNVLVSVRPAQCLKLYYYRTKLLSVLKLRTEINSSVYPLHFLTTT